MIHRSSLCCLLADVQPVRAQQHVRMALVHIRMAVGLRVGEQHTGDDQSGRQLAAVRGQGAARPGHGAGAQPGVQGGKNRGLYLSGVFTLLLLTI